MQGLMVSCRRARVWTYHPPRGIFNFLEPNVEKMKRISFELAVSGFDPRIDSVNVYLINEGTLRV